MRNNCCDLYTQINHFCSKSHIFSTFVVWLFWKFLSHIVFWFWRKNESFIITDGQLVVPWLNFNLKICLCSYLASEENIPCAFIWINTTGLYSWFVVFLCFLSALFVMVLLCVFYSRVSLHHLASYRTRKTTPFF